MARIKRKRLTIIAALVLCASVFVVAQFVSNLLPSTFTVTSTTNMVELSFETDPSGEVNYDTNIDFNLLIDSYNPAGVSGELIITVTIPSGFTPSDIEIWKQTAIPAEFPVNATGHAVIPMTLQPLENKILPMRIIFHSLDVWTPDSLWQIDFQYYIP